MTAKKVEYRRNELVVHIPDTRGVHVSPWGRGNLKLGPGIYTYSKLPGLPQPHGGTCPGATDTCLRVCYAFRVRETPLVWQMWEENTKRGYVVPRLPPDAEIIRIHVAGDFDSKLYINAWYLEAKCRPDVRFFGYTRSWRVPELLPELERLRELPNVQLFASVDDSDECWPPDEWRRAMLVDPKGMAADLPDPGGDQHHIYYDSIHHTSRPAYICPEATGRKPSCEACRYCIDGKRGDVVFPLH